MGKCLHLQRILIVAATNIAVNFIEKWLLKGKTLLKANNRRQDRIFTYYSCIGGDADIENASHGRQ